MNTATRSAMRELLARRKQELDHYRLVASTDPQSSLALMAKAELNDIDGQLHRAFGGHCDMEFRTALALGGSVEFTVPNVRALGATTFDTLGSKSFVSAFMAAGVVASPLVELSTQLTTSSNDLVSFGYVAENIDANGVVAPNSSITADDPVFGGGVELWPYGYKSLIEISSESVFDGAFDVETFAAERVGPINLASLNADAWGGSGSDEPQGLLAGLSTVTAAGTSVVTFDDVAKLLNAVPAAYRYSGRCHVLLSPGAHIDLMEEEPTHAWHTGTIHGVPFRVDTALADPATTTKSVVAGDFRSAYLTRLAPLRVDVDGEGGFGNDMVRCRVVLPADGEPMVTDAARALVHP